MAKNDPLHPDEVRMSFGEHLEELRKRLIHGMIGVVLTMVITLYYGVDVIKFLAKPLLRAQIAAGQEPGMQALSPAAPFTVYFKTALILGIIIASPWLVLQVWKFIAAGLYSHERKIFHILCPFSAVMTTLGLMFSYYIMLPIALAFLITFASSYGNIGSIEDIGEQGPLERVVQWFASNNEEEDEPPTDEGPAPESDKANSGAFPKITPSPADTPALSVPRFREDPTNLVDGQIWFNLESGELKMQLGKKTLIYDAKHFNVLRANMNLPDYINFVLLMTLGIVIGFQLPVVLLIGGWTQIIDPKWVGQYRKYCLFICVIAGALLTPQDPISMMVLAVPLYLLFELGLFLAGLVYKRPGGSQESA